MTSETCDLKAKITEDMKAAMRAQNKELLGTIRLLLAAIKQKEVDERIVLSDSDVLDVITKMIKQRKDSVEQYLAGNRPDLAENESREIVCLQAYLPEPLSEEAIEKLIETTLSEVQPQGLKDMGKVMNVLREKAQGRVDMGSLSARLKARLSA